ncbi:MAG TPA: TraR/DksA C4-type zinc finger protein [Candidatus Babeliales bacterium]|jgi:DnaK suppressor protein|nr:TraR/DksA C4-type zinc finger protein [Candidatus Babeliales bacterium]
MATTNNKLDAIKKELLERKQVLDEQLSQRSFTQADTTGKDPGDQALSSTMETLQRSLQDTDYEEYNRITQALEKIADGSYGICVDCNEMIQERRLKFYPNAARCLACQELYEDTQENISTEE